MSRDHSASSKAGQNDNGESKVVVITGASSGIGKATATALVNEGHRVALIARSEDKLNKLVDELGSENAFSVAADVSEYEALENAFEKINTRFSHIDAVFANAGVLTDKSSVL